MDIRSFLQYLQYEKRYSRHTIIAYENDLLQFSDFIEKIYEIKDLKVVKHLHVRSWMVALIQGKIDPRSINRKLSSLKSFFKFHLKKGTITNDPLAKIIAPKISKRLPAFINSSQMKTLWQSYDFGEGFSGIRNRLIFEILYATGIRRSELISLVDLSLDLRSKQIKVLGKGNKERIIPVSPELISLIKEYIRERNRRFPLNSFSAFVVSDSGEKMTDKKIYWMVNKILGQTTTLEKKSPHVLRHTFATHLLNNGAEINAIKELLGHSSLAATQVYTHTSIDKLKNIYKKAHPKA